MFSTILAASFVAALAPQALANLYITSPVATTSCAAGQTCNAAWNDDGTQPSLATIGPCTVGIYVGSQQTQYMLQSLGSVDVSQEASASFVPQADIGDNSNLYFLRFTSENYQVNGFPYEGFSAKFTLTGMTGTFNATEQSLMSAPTVAIGSTTSAAATTTGSVASTTSAAGSSSGISTSTTAKPASGTGSTSSHATSSHASSTATTSTGAAAPALGSSSHAFAIAAVVASAFIAAAF